MILYVSLVRTPGPGITTSIALMVIGWFLLLALTPCYHPYARLWLPFEAFGWILMAVGAAGILLSMIFWSTWAGPGYWSGRRRTYVDDGPADPRAY